jgi:hypothetical protein
MRVQAQGGFSGLARTGNLSVTGGPVDQSESRCGYRNLTSGPFIPSKPVQSSRPPLLGLGQLGDIQTEIPHNLVILREGSEQRPHSKQPAYLLFGSLC